MRDVTLLYAKSIAPICRMFRAVRKSQRRRNHGISNG